MLSIFPNRFITIHLLIYGLKRYPEAGDNNHCEYQGEGKKFRRFFWVKAENVLYTALIAFIWYEGMKEKNLNTLLDL